MPLTLVDSEKDIGIIVNLQLKFLEHNEKMILKDLLLIRMFGLIFKLLDNQIFVQPFLQ